MLCLLPRALDPPSMAEVISSSSWLDPRRSAPSDNPSAPWGAGVVLGPCTQTRLGEGCLPYLRHLLTTLTISTERGPLGYRRCPPPRPSSPCPCRAARLCPVPLVHIYLLDPPPDVCMPLTLLYLIHPSRRSNGRPRTETPSSPLTYNQFVRPSRPSRSSTTLL